MNKRRFKPGKLYALNAWTVLTPEEPWQNGWNGANEFEKGEIFMCVEAATKFLNSNQIFLVFLGPDCLLYHFSLLVATESFRNKR